MASQDFSLVHHGIYDVSGAALVTAVGRVNIPFAAIASGAALYIVPAGAGQVAVLETEVLP